ncbi:hypothetical protein [Candidatus Francisella endociliophora]|uniref:hypothetical protein n=1 Tax=Candidatus Francisella endociliophora TaxID=653937 RepID=UPI000AA5B438|nr:hypothetical protein [Francisella sp. FSC1006]
MRNKKDFTLEGSKNSVKTSNITIELEDDVCKLALLRAKELNLSVNDYLIYLIKEDLNI